MTERTCSIEDCGATHYGRGFCQKHYHRWRRHADPHFERPKATPSPCSVEGCDKFTGLPGTARGLCSAHYWKWQTYGDPLGAAPPRPDECVIEGCDADVYGHGWCSRHYTRWRRYGSPEARMPGDVVDGKRICPTCAEDKPRTCEFWYSGSTEDGFANECKECARARRRRQPSIECPKWSAQCAVCAVTFLADKRRSLHCSAECSAVAVRKQKLDHAARRRVLVQSQFVETVDRLIVFERDEWMCGLCGDDIDPDLCHPHPMSASLDHIVPLSRGGDHSYDNSQAAHLRCNCSKGARMT